MSFVCRSCGSRFVSLRSARVHLYSCVGGVYDIVTQLDVDDK